MTSEVNPVTSYAAKMALPGPQCLSRWLPGVKNGHPVHHFRAQNRSKIDVSPHSRTATRNSQKKKSRAFPPARWDRKCSPSRGVYPATGVAYPVLPNGRRRKIRSSQGSSGRGVSSVGMTEKCSYQREARLFPHNCKFRTASTSR